MNTRAIAIDGPSGAGKSTLARYAAKELGFLYVDTGAIYRTLALFALRQGVDPADANAVTALLPQVHISLTYGEDGLQHMSLQGEDVTEDIRRHAVSAAASQVSAIPAVRDYLLETQRRLAREHDVVMDGRDIGTVVLPQAQVKIFLTATPEDRAQRRYEELLRRGQSPEYDQVLQDVKDRDFRDTHRAAAPLRQGEDALFLDTTGCTFEESAGRLLNLIKERLDHE